MGLLSDRHFHRHDNTIHVKFPDTIKVEEYKAPTDESIRLLNEMQDKTIENIVAKIPVTNNLVDGTIYVIDMLRTTAAPTYRIIVKFKINGHEFVVEKAIDHYQLSCGDEGRDISIMAHQLKDYGKSVMLWYALKSFSLVAFEQILGQKPTEDYFKEFFELPFK